MKPRQGFAEVTLPDASRTWQAAASQGKSPMLQSSSSCALAVQACAICPCSPCRMRAKTRTAPAVAWDLYHLRDARKRGAVPSSHLVAGAIVDLVQGEPHQTFKVLVPQHFIWRVANAERWPRFSDHEGVEQIGIQSGVRQIARMVPPVSHRRSGNGRLRNSVPFNTGEYVIRDRADMGGICAGWATL